MELIKTLEYGDYKTEVSVSTLVKGFLGDKIFQIIEEINIDKWYRSWLLNLDENKDGIPDEKFGKEFQLIYHSIIQNPEDYLSKEDIAEELEIKSEDIILDGSKTIFDNSTKFWIRWILVKKN